MNKQTKDILLKFDELDCYETPSDFNYNTLKSRVADLVKELERSFNLKFLIDDQVQDASFFCDVKIPRDLIMNPGINLLYSIRISNFGRLATMSFEEAYSVNVSDTIKEILKKENFIFIHSYDLEEVYDGLFEKFKGIESDSKPTWWIRYFDYL